MLRLAAITLAAVVAAGGLFARVTTVWVTEVRLFGRGRDRQTRPSVGLCHGRRCGHAIGCGPDWRRHFAATAPFSSTVADLIRAAVVLWIVYAYATLALRTVIYNRASLI